MVFLPSSSLLSPQILPPPLPPHTHNTQHTQYFIYTSDHGYNLGQFRVDSHKTQVYDHNLRVPAIILGPKVSPGSLFTPVTSMVDLGPTILELAAGGNDAGAVPAIMDGMSFAPMLTGQGTRPWKGAALVEYLSIRKKPTSVISSMVCGGDGGADSDDNVAGLLDPAARDAMIDACVYIVLCLNRTCRCVVGYMYGKCAHEGSKDAVERHNCASYFTYAHITPWAMSSTVPPLPAPSAWR
jgi:hypothetical protein